MPPHELQRLKARHFEIVDLCLQGHTPSMIAADLGMSPLGVSNIINSPKTQDEIARRRELQNCKKDEAGVSNLVRAKTVLEDRVVDAAQVHVDVLDDPEASIPQKQSSANAILAKVFPNDFGAASSGNATIIAGENIQILNLSIKEALDGDPSRKIKSA